MSAYKSIIKIEEIVYSELPKASDIERSVLSALVHGEQPKMIIDMLDDTCFCCKVKDLDNAVVFKEASRLFAQKKTIELGNLSNQLGIDASEISAHYPAPCMCSDKYIDYYILILKGMKIQRKIVCESLNLLEQALQNDIPIDDYPDMFQSVTDGIREDLEKIHPIDKGMSNEPPSNDWYVNKKNPEKKFKVMPGKNGWGDYCWIDGKSVNEKKMLRNGYQRISLPVGKTTEEE